jgi:hypothetical protein
MLATPGTPAERINVLRAAYIKALKDPELLLEAEKGKMDVDPSPGEELEALIRNCHGSTKRSPGPGEKDVRKLTCCQIEEERFVPAWPACSARSTQLMSGKG